MSDIEYVELHGNRVAYREAGSGQVVVLIHGMAGSSDAWQAVLPALAKNFRVIAPDLLGHGQSVKPRTDYSLGAFAASLRDLLDELGVSQATIVGHSLGGGVAMQFLYQHPEYCQRLILISSGGLGPDVGWILRLLAAPGAEFVLPVVAPKVVLSIGNRMRSWLSKAGLNSARAGPIWDAYCSLSDPPTRAAFLRTLRSVVDYRGQSVSALGRLGLRLEVPTLVIWGERDQIIPVEHGSSAHAARHGSRLEVLPGLGHFPHVEAPTAVVTAIEEFIAGCPDTKETATQAYWLRRPPSPRTFWASEEFDVEARTLIDNLKSRKQVEVAIGVLMGLRAGPQNEALSEFTSAVQEMGLRPGELACALVDVASGSDTSPHRAEVQHRWRHLLALRGLDGRRNVAAVDHPIRVPYGPGNRSTIC
jgi:pimeloyl-ACP methyl ester carboxylesterase